MDEAGATVEASSGRWRSLAISAPAHRPSPWSVRFAFRVLGRAAANFLDDRGTQMAAAISYYALFSLFPLTLLAFSVFGIVIRDPALQERALNAIIDFLPIRGSSVADSLRRVADLGPTITAVALIGSFWSAGALSAAVRSALNVAFEADRGRPLLRAKLIDYALLPIIGIPLIGGVVVTTVWRLAQREITAAFPFLGGPFAWAWGLGAIAIAPVLSFLAFLLIYWLVPNRRLYFRYIWPGALLATVAFEGLKNGFTVYLSNFGNYEVVYGSLGSVVILLFWIFVTANILIYGGEVAAEVPHVLHEEPRHGVTPEEGDWKRSLFGFLRGLVLAGDEEVKPRAPSPRRRRNGSA